MGDIFFNVKTFLFKQLKEKIKGQDTPGSTKGSLQDPGQISTLFLCLILSSLKSLKIATPQPGCSDA